MVPASLVLQDCVFRYSGRPDVGRLQALGTLVDLELDFLVLGKRLESGSEDAGVMDEQVLATSL